MLFLGVRRPALPACVNCAAPRPTSPPEPPEAVALTDLDRAIDTLIEMKNLSEVAVGLAYSALVYRDRSLAAEVRHLEDRLDEMNHRLELWVLRSATDGVDPAPLRGLLHLAAAAEDIGDQAQSMVWMVERSTSSTPCWRCPRRHRRGRRAHAGRSRSVGPRPDPGRDRAAHRARLHGPGHRAGGSLLVPAPTPRRDTEGDSILASGPEEGRAALAEMFGWRLVEDDEGGIELESLLEN